MLSSTLMQESIDSLSEKPWEIPRKSLMDLLIALDLDSSELVLNSVYFLLLVSGYQATPLSMSDSKSPKELNSKCKSGSWDDYRPRISSSYISDYLWCVENVPVIKYLASSDSSTGFNVRAFKKFWGEFQTSFDLAFRAAANDNSSPLLRCVCGVYIDILQSFEYRAQDLKSFSVGSQHILNEMLEFIDLMNEILLKDDLVTVSFILHQKRTFETIDVLATSTNAQNFNRIYNHVLEFFVKSCALGLVTNDCSFDSPHIMAGFLDSSLIQSFIETKTFWISMDGYLVPSIYTNDDSVEEILALISFLKQHTILSFLPKQLRISHKSEFVPKVWGNRIAAFKPRLLPDFTKLVNPLLFQVSRNKKSGSLRKIQENSELENEVKESMIEKHGFDIGKIEIHDKVVSWRLKRLESSRLYSRSNSVKNFSLQNEVCGADELFLNPNDLLKIDTDNKRNVAKESVFIEQDDDKLKFEEETIITSKVDTDTTLNVHNENINTTLEYKKEPSLVEKRHTISNEKSIELFSWFESVTSTNSLLDELRLFCGFLQAACIYKIYREDTLPSVTNTVFDYFLMENESFFRDIHHFLLLSNGGQRILKLIAAQETISFFEVRELNQALNFSLERCARPADDLQWELSDGRLLQLRLEIPPLVKIFLGEVFFEACNRIFRHGIRILFFILNLEQFILDSYKINFELAQVLKDLLCLLKELYMFFKFRLVYPLVSDLSNELGKFRNVASDWAENGCFDITFTISALERKYSSFVEEVNEKCDRVDRIAPIVEKVILATEQNEVQELKQYLEILRRDTNLFVNNF